MGISISKTGYFRINEPSVIHQLFDEEVVAINLSTGAYHALPGVAGEALLLIGSSGSSIEEIAPLLAAKYDVPLDLVERDLDVFFAQLQKQSIVTATDARPASLPLPSLSVAQRTPYTAPRLESYDDLAGLVLLDPVHDVGAAGWPNAAPVASTSNTLATEGFPRLSCRLAGPNVIFERFDTETVAMNLGTGSYHSLSGAAEDVFLLLPHDPNTWEIRNALAAKYAVDLPDLEQALQRYFDELVQGSLIVLHEITEDSSDRVLDLGPVAGDADNRPVFVAPRLETFAQPTFDTPAIPVEPGINAAGEAIVFDPFLPRRYGLRSSELFYSTASTEIVVADREFGVYFKLNEPASDVFRLLADGTSVDEIMTALEAKYDAPSHSLRASLMLLLFNLKKLRLLRDASSESPSPDQPALNGSHARIAFTGFDVAVHRDLADLMLAFNAAPSVLPKPQLSEARQFIQLLDAYFHATAEATAVVEGVYSIASHTVSIRCAGAGQTAGLLRAFSHLSAASASLPEINSTLTIHAWNRGSVAPGLLLDMALSRFYDTWSEVCGPRGEFLGMHGGSISAIYHPGPDTLSIVDLESGNAYYLGRAEEPLPFWELSSPFRHILHPWFASRGLQYTHAGAVGGPNGGVLLAGKGGAGKSTTTLLCAAAGMLYAGDDYCLTDAESGRVYSLYNTAKLKGPDDLDRVPGLRGLSYNSDSFEHGGMGKGTYCLAELWPEQMVSSLPVGAIVLPVVTGEVNSRLAPCSAGDALLALVPSTVAQLPQVTHADCERLAALTASVPAFHLYLGSDLDQIPRLLKDLVA